MIHRAGNPRLVLESRSVLLLAAEFSAQQLKRHKPIQARVPRLVNAAHAANAERLDDLEVIKSTFHSRFLTTAWAANSCQWLSLACIDGRAARRTTLGHGDLSSIDMEIDCNIDEFQSKDDGWGECDGEKRKIGNVQIRGAKKGCTSPSRSVSGPRTS
jgi:hypothetical protein